MEVLVLGPGCKKCVLTCDAIKKVVEQAGAEVTIRKVEDIMEIMKIMKYNVIATPAVVVDGEVKIKVLKIKWQWVLLGVAATALSILFASRLIPNPKMVPLVPMIVGIAALSVITLFDRSDEENKAWTISA
ncbi:MAG: thioredoxin family protein [Proteiniphilum sp.]|nr:thioredoxin family protein [Proteiniphilum sp.]